MNKKKSELGAFESGLKELETIVASMDTGDLPLEESLQQFERGIQLTARLHEQLQAAELRVKKLLEKNGAVTAVPFETRAMDEDNGEENSG